MTTDFDRLVRRARHLRDQRERPRVHPLDILIYGNESAADEAVSYTHLTLPTIYSV